MTTDGTSPREEFEERIERLHQSLGDGEGSARKWFAGRVGRTSGCVGHWITGESSIPEYAWGFVEALEEIAELRAETEIDLPEDRDIRTRYRDLLRKLRAIKAEFRRLAQGYYIRIEELEEDLESRLDPYAGLPKEAEFGDGTPAAEDHPNRHTTVGRQT